MSETVETIEQSAPRPKVKRKYARRAPRTEPVKAPDEFAGMTETQCCTACKAGHCIISGNEVCGHPMKTPQIPSGDSAAQARFLRAKKVLIHRQIDLRGT